jgi:hypothetical protein
MSLTWGGTQGNLVAVGTRATYTIQTVGPLTRYILQGIGHDELPLLDLPPFGAQFTDLWTAQRAAAEIDKRPNHDPQMSGA